MLPDRAVWLAHERVDEMLAAAARETRTRELLGERRPCAPRYAPLLDRLGHTLIEVGLNLRARYGRFELEGVEG